MNFLSQNLDSFKSHYILLFCESYMKAFLIYYLQISLHIIIQKTERQMFNNIYSTCITNIVNYKENYFTQKTDEVSKRILLNNYIELSK